MKRTYIIISTLFLTIIHLTAQQTPVSEMYMIDYYYANPAEAGRKNCLIAHLSDVHQWLGIKNAPNMQTLSIHKGFKKEHRMSYHGLGGIIFRDQNGHYGSTGFKASYAFHVLINERKKTYLSMGLSGEYAQRALDENGFLNYNSDPALTGSGQSAWNPNADFGIILSNKTFLAGFALLDLIPVNNSISAPVASERQNRKYSLFFSKSLPLTHTIEAEPSFMFKINEKLLNEADFNCKLFFNESFWLGLSYRHALDAFPGKSLSLIIYAGVSYNNWCFDYSFAANTGSLQKYHYGTHGLTVSYKICSNEKGAVPCPAYK